MAKKGKKQAKKKPAKKRKPSEPVIIPERVLEGLTGKEDGIVGTELLELGDGRAPFSDVRSKKACAARGGIWRRPPPWSALPGVCARPPAPRLFGCDGASMGVGGFISKADRCPPGLVKIRTVHPRYKTGEFFMCVTPSTAPKIRGRAALFAPPGRLFGSGLGELNLLPDEISFPMLLVGNLTGTGIGITAERVLPALVGLGPSWGVRAAIGGGGAVLYLLTKKSFPLGLALGLLPGAIEGLVDLVISLVEPAGRPKELTGGRLGQLEPAQIRELEKIAEELSGPEDEEFEEPELFGEIPEEIEEEPVIPATFF